jgi:hypothetical protein
MIMSINSKLGASSEKLSYIDFCVSIFKHTYAHSHTCTRAYVHLMHDYKYMHTYTPDLFYHVFVYTECYHHEDDHVDVHTYIRMHADA